jgi:cytochrome c553
MKYYEAGQRLFRSGDAARGLPACMACHGPAGQGNPGPAYPHVAGQQSWYTTRRLQEFRAGTTTERERALFDIMATVAKTLTDEEIGALSSYMQGLHPRPDAATLAAMAKQPAAAPAAPPAPTPAPPAPAPAKDAEALPGAEPAPPTAPPAQGS